MNAPRPRLRSAASSKARTSCEGMPPPKTTAAGVSAWSKSGAAMCSRYGCLSSVRSRVWAGSRCAGKASAAKRSAQPAICCKSLPSNGRILLARCATWAAWPATLSTSGLRSVKRRNKRYQRKLAMTYHSGHVSVAATEPAITSPVSSAMRPPRIAASVVPMRTVSSMKSMPRSIGHG